MTISKRPPFPASLAGLKPANENIPDAPEKVWQFIALLASEKGLILNHALLKPIVMKHFSKHPDEAQEIVAISKYSSMVEQTERCILIASALNYALAEHFDEHGHTITDKTALEPLCVNQLATLGVEAVNDWTIHIPFTRDWAQAQNNPDVTNWKKVVVDGTKEEVSDLRALLENIKDPLLKRSITMFDPSPERDQMIYNRMLKQIATVTTQFDHDIHAKPAMITSDTSMLLVTANMLWEAAQLQVKDRLTALNNEIKQQPKPLQ